MTPNTTLSIPAALRTARPDDYYENAATIDWPNGANGQPLVLDGSVELGVVFGAGGNPALAGDFVRFLAESTTGNSNAGHEHGTQLNEDDQRALIEFLKTL